MNWAKVQRWKIVSNSICNRSIWCTLLFYVKFTEIYDFLSENNFMFSLWFIVRFYWIKMSADTSTLPSELITTPQPLIGLLGLDVDKNPIHKSILDSFINNRKPDRWDKLYNFVSVFVIFFPFNSKFLFRFILKIYSHNSTLLIPFTLRRAQIQFKLLPFNYEFPVSKPKRQTYEWYQPKGILKRNWMLKHLHVLPAIVVLFQDIEWNDPQWSEKLLQCASIVQSLKNSLQVNPFDKKLYYVYEWGSIWIKKKTFSNIKRLQGRNTKIAVVLLQKGSPIPSTDVIAVERSANLTSKCDINPKMLFVLSHNEHLMGEFETKFR